MNDKSIHLRCNPIADVNHVYQMWPNQIRYQQEQLD